MDINTTPVLQSKTQNFGLTVENYCYSLQNCQGNWTTLLELRLLPTRKHINGSLTKAIFKPQQQTVALLQNKNEQTGKNFLSKARRKEPLLFASWSFPLKKQLKRIEDLLS